MINKKEYILQPHNLCGEEEPKKEDFGDLLCLLNPESVGFCDTDIGTISYNKEKYQKALTVFKSKYPDKPEYDWVSFEEKELPKPYYPIYLKMSDGSGRSAKPRSYRYVGDEFTKWCCKESHDLKVSKWEKAQVLYDGFRVHNSKHPTYSKNDLTILFPLDGGIRINYDGVSYANENSITLYQLESITGLQMKEL